MNWFIANNFEVDTHQRRQKQNQIKQQIIYTSLRTLSQIPDSRSQTQTKNWNWKLKLEYESIYPSIYLSIYASTYIHNCNSENSYSMYLEKLFIQ